MSSCPSNLIHLLTGGARIKHVIVCGPVFIPESFIHHHLDVFVTLARVSIGASNQTEGENTDYGPSVRITNVEVDCVGVNVLATVCVVVRLANVSSTSAKTWWGHAGEVRETKRALGSHTFGVKTVWTAVIQGIVQQLDCVRRSVSNRNNEAAASVAARAAVNVCAIGGVDISKSTSALLFWTCQTLALRNVNHVKSYLGVSLPATARNCQWTVPVGDAGTLHCHDNIFVVLATVTQSTCNQTRRENCDK